MCFASNSSSCHINLGMYGLEGLLLFSLSIIQDFLFHHLHEGIRNEHVTSLSGSYEWKSPLSSSFSLIGKCDFSVFPISISHFWVIVNHLFKGIRLGSIEVEKSL